MDRREPARIVTMGPPSHGSDAPTPPTPPSKRFARLVTSPVARRLAVSKIGRAGILLAAALGLLVVGGSSLSRNLVIWLHAQKPYQLSFRDIELVPEPPKWIRPGRLGLLEEVRDGRVALDRFSMADLNLDLLLNDFRRNPWIARAERAAKTYPNKVSIQLVYFEPVAIVQTERDGRKFSVDRDGTVLRFGDLDIDQAGPLVEIIVAKPRDEPKPGLAWPGDADDSRMPKVDPQFRLLTAAKLAGFFKQKLIAEGTTSPAFVPERIVAQHDKAIFVQMKDKSFVLWKSLSNPDSPGEPTDSEKWNRLIAKAKSEGGLRLKKGEYIDFTTDGVVTKRFDGT